ncbi:MAG: 3-isopropylmalate dehydrogenase [Pseudomonadota bacterium]
MTNSYTISILAGDAIGPEITAQAVRVFEALEQHRSIQFELIHAPFGASAYFSHGHSFPDETKKACDDADAILKGPAGLSFEDTQKIPLEERPERGAILPLRKRYDTFANLRPIFLPSAMAQFSPLKSRIVEDGVDIMLVRELVGGLYFGAKHRGIKDDGVRYVNETLEYDDQQIRRILRVAFEQAESRRGCLHHIHKSNVLLSSVLWNEVLEEIRGTYPNVEVHHMLVDAAATALCLNPGQFDVMVTENMFGDILSDQGGGILGSLGLMPSACIGPSKAYYEPSHGSAPDIAGQGIANPYSMIGSVAMMLDISFGLRNEAQCVWSALEQVFAGGFITPDLGNADTSTELVSTEKFGDLVIDALNQGLSE